MTAIPPMVTLAEYQRLGEELRRMEGLVLRSADEVEELRDKLFAANREIERLKERAR